MKKLISTLMIFAFMFVMVGCNNTENISIQKINDTITKVQTVVSKLETIPEQNLIIEDIMDKDTNYSSIDDEEGTGYNGSTFTSGTKQII